MPRPLFRFALGFFLTALGLGGLWYALFRVQLGKPTELGRILHELILHRQDMADAHPGRRAFLAGGSNVGYSFRAELLSDYLPMPALNYGTHAGLNLEYLLDLVAREAREGDFVILALEYQHYTYDGRNTVVQVDYVCAYDPAYFDGLPWLEQARLIYSFSFLGLTEPGLSLVQRALQRSPPRAPVRRGEAVPWLNRWGDSTTTSLANRTPDKFDQVLRGSPARLELDGSEASWDVLRTFLRRMEERGVSVFHAWPVTRDFETYHDPSAREAFARIEAFFSAHGIPTLGRPEDFLFPAEDFYDTVYHLVLERTPVPTRRLGRALHSHLEQTVSRH